VTAASLQTQGEEDQTEDVLFTFGGDVSEHHKSEDELKHMGFDSFVDMYIA